MVMSCVGFEVYKCSEPPRLLAQQFFQSPPFGRLKIFGAPPQYFHPPLVILNELSLISGCRHAKKFLLNTVLTWLVLVANLTCCKHHLSTTRHAPTPRLAFIVLFYLMIRLARGMTLWVAINVQDIIQSHQSTSIIYIHIYSFIKKLKLMQPPPPSIIERSTPKNT